MKVDALVFDCRCGGFDVLIENMKGASQAFLMERRRATIQNFRDMHDGDKCNGWGYQPVAIDVPDAVLAAANYGRAVVAQEAE